MQATGANKKCRNTARYRDSCLHYDLIPNDMLNERTILLKYLKFSYNRSENNFNNLLDYQNNYVGRLN